MTAYNYSPVICNKGATKTYMEGKSASSRNHAGKTGCPHEEE